MTVFSHAIAAVLDVKNSCGYLVSRLAAEAIALSTALDPRTAMATTPVLCANWYLAAALNTTILGPNCGGAWHRAQGVAGERCTAWVPSLPAEQPRGAIRCT
jgi:Tfp pilus assembly protein PilX